MKLAVLVVSVCGLDKRQSHPAICTLPAFVVLELELGRRAAARITLKSSKTDVPLRDIGTCLFHCDIISDVRSCSRCHKWWPARFVGLALGREVGLVSATALVLHSTTLWQGFRVLADDLSRTPG